MAALRYAIVQDKSHEKQPADSLKNEGFFVGYSDVLLQQERVYVREGVTQRFTEVIRGLPGQHIKEGESVAFCTHEGVHLYATVCRVIPRSGHALLTFWAVVDQIDLPSPYFSGDNVPFEKGGCIKGFERIDVGGKKAVHIGPYEISKENPQCN